MANRDLSNFRKVTQVVAEDTGGELRALTALGSEAIDNHQKSKITENTASARLDIGKLDNEFRINNSDNPFDDKAIQKYKADRENIISSYGSDISSLHGRAWQAESSKLTVTSDLSMQNWGYQQSEVNTTNNLKSTVAKNLDYLGEQGRAFAVDDSAGVEAAVNTEQMLGEMARGARGSMSEEKLQNVLEAFPEDAMKVFISGVAEVNPQKALQMLDDPDVKERVGDTTGWSEFRGAVENKALQFQDIAIKTEVIDKMKEAGGVYASGKVLSYAEVQTVSEGMTEPAKAYFMKINGFSKGAELSKESKLQLEDEVMTGYAEVAMNNDSTPAQLLQYQDKVFRALETESIKEDTGTAFLSQINERLGADDGLGKFGEDNWYDPDQGFAVVDSFYKNKLKIDPNSADYKLAGQKKVPIAIRKDITAKNNKVRAELYKNYYTELNAQAVTRGFANAEELNAKGTTTQKEDSWNTAKNLATSTLLRGQMPEGLRSVPTSVVRWVIANPNNKDELKKVDEAYSLGTVDRILGVR